MTCRECPNARTVPYPTKGGAMHVCTVGGCNVGMPETEAWDE